MHPALAVEEMPSCNFPIPAGPNAAVCRLHSSGAATAPAAVGVDLRAAVASRPRPIALQRFVVGGTAREERPRRTMLEENIDRLLCRAVLASSYFLSSYET